MHVILNGIDIFNFSITLVSKSIRTKLKSAVEKVFYSLKDFGNTSSASIPLTVGLSWETLVLDIENIVCPDLIEIFLKKSPDYKNRGSKLNLAATYSPTHLRMQYHRRSGA